MISGIKIQMITDNKLTMYCNYIGCRQMGKHAYRHKLTMYCNYLIIHNATKIENIVVKGSE